DLHALAHRWVQYASEDYPISFEQFLENKEPSRYQRLYNIFCFTQEQVDREVKEIPEEKTT
ncbi:unnamed protein product, partial [marine sediment metagenome]